MSRRTVASVGVVNSCERIRPERSRNPIQRLIWGPGAQMHFSNANSHEDEGSNPRMALRRLLRLYEGRQYREAATFLSRLPQYTLKSSLPDIPIDLLIESLPSSLTLVEALYARLTDLNMHDAKLLRVEQLIWRIVHLISTDQDHFRLRIWCKLLSALNKVSPTTKSTLNSKKRALERAVEGLGKHGLVQSCQPNSAESTTSNLVPLSVALREELEAKTESYKLALHKIESFGKHSDQGVQAASHQRQLSMRYSEVQQRLIDNQSLLNTLEKNNRGLDKLLGELKKRVEQDKEALRQWTGLRRCGSVDGNAKDPTLAARLLQFSRGCDLALQLMSEDSPQDEIFAQEFEEEESSSAGYHTDESCSPTPEITNSRVIVVQQQSDYPLDAAVDFQTAYFYKLTARQLTDKYSALYAHAQLNTLRALDSLPQLKEASDLKIKILYSIVVLSWRLAGTIQSSRRLQALKALNGVPSYQVGGSSSSTTSSGPITTDYAELEECIRRQLATHGAESGVREVAEKVVKQLERTLYDFPCLRGCQEIGKYAMSSARLGWACLVRGVPLVLDAAQSHLHYRPDIHARHHTSLDANSTRIRNIVWPGLRQGFQGPYLHRAVVVTF